MHRWIHLLLVWLPLMAAGQPNWEHAGIPGRVISLFCVWANPAHDTIYYGGNVSLDSTLNWQQTNPVLMYASGQWETVGPIWGDINSIVKWRDTLFVGGYFLQAGGQPIQHIAAYANGVWSPYGVFNNGIRKLKVLDDTLYVMGSFTTVDGIDSKLIAKRSGGQWVPIGDLEPSSFGGILDAEIYQGQLVACGAMTLPDGRLVIVFDGTQWSALGPGILGGVSGARCLSVFGNELYVGGQFSTADGNPGMNIMRWDGTQFNAVGDGIRWQLGSTSFAAVFTMAVHDSVLFVGGGFNYAGGVPANGVAMWDGVEWCGVPGEFLYPGTSGVEAMDFYHDTLFVACGWIVDADSVYKNAKFVGSTYPDTCSGPVGIGEGGSWHQSVVLYPNPTNEHFVLTGFMGIRMIEFFDTQGRKLRSILVQADEPINIADLTTGLYTIRLLGPKGEPNAFLRLMRE